MKFSHKAELKLSSTNLDLKEGEGCLAKHGCGGDEGFSWGIHGWRVICVRFWGKRWEKPKMEERVERKWEEVREMKVGECRKCVTFAFIYGWLTLELSPKLIANLTQVWCKCMFSEGMVKVCQRNGEVYVFMKRPRGCGCSEEGRVFWGMKGKYVSASKLSYAFSSLSSLQMLSFHSKNALFGVPNSNLNLEPFLPHLVRCFTKCFSFF